MATTAGDEQTVQLMLKRWQDPDSGLDQAWREEYMVYLSFPDPKRPNKVTVGESPGFASCTIQFPPKSHSAIDNLISTGVRVWCGSRPVTMRCVFQWARPIPSYTLPEKKRRRILPTRATLRWCNRMLLTLLLATQRYKIQRPCIDISLINWLIVASLYGNIVLQEASSVPLAAMNNGTLTDLNK